MTAKLALVVFILFLGNAKAQQVMQLAPGQAPSEQLAMSALRIKPNETLKIENLKINDQKPSTINLNLRRSEITSGDTQYIVVDDKGPRTYPFAASAHFVGSVEGKPNSYAFVSVSPNGDIRSIVHQDNDTIVNELIPGRNSKNGTAASRLVDHQKDFIDQEFSCGVNPDFFDTNPVQKKIGLEQLLKIGKIQPESAVNEAQPALRRADIIIETDYEFFQRFGTEAAALTYVANLFTYVNSRYQDEISTRFNLKQIYIRSTPSDPWTQSSTSGMLSELLNFWNTAPYASISRHHVHFLSGKPAGGGVAYVGTLGNKNYAYGVSANIYGNFDPSNPQVIWDSVVVAHEIGHAFGSTHTHNYDNPAFAPYPNTGGAIDCCYSDNANGQCGIALGGAGVRGILPGLSSVSGGSAGQGNGTIMSYCHLLTGNMSNIAWTFGSNHPYGVNASRVPTVMRNQAQTYLPLDATGVYDLSITKSGSGTITSNPAGINCGIDCSESFADGTTVTLAAAAATGYSFSGWSGDCSGTGSCTVTMNSYKSVTATFGMTSVGTLTVAKIGTGSGTVTRSGGALNCGSNCTENVPVGSIATLVATPSPGSIFAGWSGGPCNGTGTCAFTANANTTVNAQFDSGTGGNTVTPLLQTTVSGGAGSLQYYSVTVPMGAKNLVIKMGGGTGDADLYVKFGQVPTTNSYECRPYSVGNNETCLFLLPTPGTYHIMLGGYEPFSGVTLAASYQLSAKKDITNVINLLLLN